MLSLSTILKVNAISSGATGLLLVAFSSRVANLFAVDAHMPFIEVGTFLVLFALFVFVTSNINPVPRKAVTLIIALDVIWVIGSIAALFKLSSIISIMGSVLIAGVAIWVGIMALLQNRGLKDLSKYQSETIPVNS